MEFSRHFRTPAGKYSSRKVETEPQMLGISSESDEHGPATAWIGTAAGE
jgi:hypothetical protein